VLSRVPRSGGAVAPKTSQWFFPRRGGGDLLRAGWFVPWGLPAMTKISSFVVEKRHTPGHERRKIKKIRVFFKVLQAGSFEGLTQRPESDEF